MHKLMTAGAVLEHDLSELRQLIERHTGLIIDCSSTELTTRVADYLGAEEVGSPGVLLERLRASEHDMPILPGFLDSIVNSTTGFYRHPGALNALSQHVVPQLCAKKSADGSGAIRIWSAGCATGEETYSIAMAICDTLSQVGTVPANIACKPGTQSTISSRARTGGIAENSSSGPGAAKCASPFSLHIVGSDLIPKNIEVADRGVYPQSALEGLPSGLIRNYFSKLSATAVAPSDTAIADSDAERISRNGNSGNRRNTHSCVPYLIVKPRLRSLVTFNCMNLARPGYIGRFDVIFCMDVLPHMARSQRIALMERLHLYLEPGGYLFLSQTEKLIPSNLNFRAETFDGYTFHRKPLAASAAYGR